jgi:beta-galactosidase
MSTRSFPFHFGAAFYPEHWPEERWIDDVRLMRQAGLNVARLGEFAWSTLEPEAGKFCLDWLGRAIDLLADNGIASILGTPTAAPPAWLVEMHPGILAIDENNRLVQFGNRCHYCVNSLEFHEAVCHVVGAMGEHFGSNPNVIGWQIDNEFNRVCYCNHCREQFQRYLAEKFGSLEILNAKWSTRYWSQSYTSWDQIPIPVGSHNPGLMLEFKHFVTHSYRAFQKLQIDILRRYVPAEVWITHNFMGWYDGYDPYPLSEDLDIASWDWYVSSGHNEYQKSGAVHDLTRSFKQKNFILMETQPGSVNWSGVNNILNKGEARAMAWHAVAHGADGILYWQWRSAPGGQEQYHGTLVDQSGQPRPFFDEVRRIGREFKQVSAALERSLPKARVGMVYDPESRWSINWQRHHQEFDYLKFFNHYYCQLAMAHLGIDILAAKSIVSPQQLSKYKVIIVPALLIQRGEFENLICVYVKNGGHLVLTLRTGMKDSFNALLPARQPGLLAELAGVEVEEYYALDELVPVKGNWLAGSSQVWAERLKLLGSSSTQVIARYGKSNGWLDDQPAISVNSFGKGLVYFNGAYLDSDSQKHFIDRVLKNANLRPLPAPPGVEIASRIRPDGREITFAINHTQEPKILNNFLPALDLLTGKQVSETIELAPYGVAVLKHLEQ